MERIDIEKCDQRAWNAVVKALGLESGNDSFVSNYAGDWAYAFAESGLDPSMVATVEDFDNGENDGAAWICFGTLKDGRWFRLAAGCDYTGWDCIGNHGEWSAHATREDAIRNGMGADERDRLGLTLDGEGVP